MKLTGKCEIWISFKYISNKFKGKKLRKNL